MARVTDGDVVPAVMLSPKARKRVRLIRGTAGGTGCGGCGDGGRSPGLGSATGGGDATGGNWLVVDVGVLSPPHASAQIATQITIDARNIKARGAANEMPSGRVVTCGDDLAGFANARRQALRRTA